MPGYVIESIVELYDEGYGATSICNLIYEMYDYRMYASKILTILRSKGLGNRTQAEAREIKRKNEFARNRIKPNKYRMTG